MKKETGMTLINISGGLDSVEAVRSYNEEPFKKTTPAEKVKRSGKGYDYVKGSYMDSEFKKHSPLYEYVSMTITDVLPLGQVRAEVVLRSRVTGNTEVGTGAARIQVTKEARRKLESGNQSHLLPFDVVDYDKNVKSALEQARKNAQRQFGIASDVYRRQEFDPTKEELTEFSNLLNQMSFKWKQHFSEVWEDTGFAYQDVIDQMKEGMEEYLKKKTTTIIKKGDKIL